MRSGKSRMTSTAAGLLLALAACLPACCPKPPSTGPLVVSTSGSSVRLLPSSEYQVNQAWMRYVVVTVATLRRDNEILRRRLQEECGK